MHSSDPDHNNHLVRTVFSMLSHSVRWRASLQERIRLFGDLHHAPIEVANPLRGQLNRENGYFPVPVRT